MENTKFKIGDIVTIKSDKNLKLTINEANNDGSYECMWFDITFDLKKHDFKEEVLELSN